MHIINKKIHPVSTLAICCLLSTSFFSVHLSAAAASDPEPVLSTASSDVAQPNKPFNIYDACLADFKIASKREILGFSANGNVAKSKGNFDEAIPLLREAARFSDFKSMILLGEICELQKDFCNAYTWYVLAFEEHWLSKAGYLETALTKLSVAEFRTSVLNSLSSQEKTDPSKFFREIDNINTKRFSWFSGEPTAKKFEQIKKLSHYPSKEYTELRELRFEVEKKKISGCKDIWFNLGSDCYRANSYNKSRICFERSESSSALFLLGSLYDNEKIEGGVQEAARYYRKSGTLEGLVNLLKLHVDDTSVRLLTHENVQEIKEEINMKITAENNEEKKQHYLGGILFAEKQYKEAAIHLAQAVTLGNTDALELLIDVQKIIDQQNKLEKLKTPMVDDAASAQASSQEMPEEDESDEDDSSDSQEEHGVDGAMARPEIIPDLTASAAHSPAIAQILQAPRIKKPLARVERIARAERKLLQTIQKAKKHSFAFQASSGNEEAPQVLLPLTFSFLSDDVRADYAALSGDYKLARIIADMWEKPWATEGEGKPKILNGIHLGHKSCIARRLDHKNRFVYKVTGPRQILILSCNGHYDD